MRMRTGVVVALLTTALGTVGAASDGMAAVICKKKKGAVVIRDEACRKKETAVDLSEFGALGPKGDKGDKGDTGDTGARGPSTGYVTSFTDQVDLLENQYTTLMTLDVPTGSYVVTARLQGRTVTDPDGPPGNSYRYDCYLTSADTTMDDLLPRVGMEPGVESYLTWMGAFTGDGPISFYCLAGNQHPLRALSGVMTAIRVDALE